MAFPSIGESFQRQMSFMIAKYFHERSGADLDIYKKINYTT